MKKPPQRVEKNFFPFSLRRPVLLSSTVDTTNDDGTETPAIALVGIDQSATNERCPVASHNIDDSPRLLICRRPRNFLSNASANGSADLDCGDGDGSADTDFDDLATDILATVVAMVIAIVVPTTTVAVASATTDIPVAGKGRRGQHERSQCNDNLFHDVLLDK